MPRLLSLLFLTSVLGLAACSSNGDNSPALSGTYSGPYTSFEGSSGTLNVVIPSAVSDAVFNWSASGTVTVGGFDLPVVMSGTGEYVFPNIAFTVIPTGGSAQSRRLVGTVSGDGMTITASQNTVLLGAGTEERFVVTL